MQKADKWWTMRESRWLAMVIILFLVFQTVFRLKFGAVFTLAFGWLLLHQWMLRLADAESMASSLAEKITISFYYAFIISFVGFITFFVVNALLRSVNNDWAYFQPP